MSKTMTILFGYLITALFAGEALADLLCKDYVPVNWTTPRARINAVSFTSPSEPFLPTNMSATSPWTFGKKTDPGVIFHLRTCNSTSLKLKSYTTVTCNNDGTGCFRDYWDYVQIIHPSTGHCLTNSNYSANTSTAVFQACDTNPKTPYQLWQSDRLIFLEEECCFYPGPVTDWNADYTSVIPSLFFQSNQPSFQYAKDHKTVTLVRGSYPAFQLTFKPVDPLTSK